MAPPLEERFYETQRAQLFRWLPWLHLFRAFRIALDVRKMLLGALAAAALTFGGSLIDALPFAPVTAPSSRISPLVEWPGIATPSATDAAAPAPWAGSIAAPWLRVLLPMETIVEPGSRLFRRGSTWADVAYAWTQLLFRLAVWSLLGGAIARIAAVQFARRESITARSAAGYAAARFGSTFAAPLLPLVFIGFFWLVCCGLGFVGRLPGIGTTIVGALWFLPLLIGIALAVMLLVIAVSWPLMVATISAEGTDAFDALSRGYDYVLNRTWYALWLLLLTVVYGAVVAMFVSVIANGGVQLANWNVASGMGESRIAELLPAQSPDLPADPSLIAAGPQAGLGGRAATLWLRLLAWLLWGFLISYFWTAVTISYFLLRLSLDARPLDDVHIPPAAETESGLPLVGMPAAERREAAGVEPGAPEPPAVPPA